MKRINPIIFPAITLLMAAGLIRLRDWQLETGFDAQGIPVGGATTWLVLGLTAVAALLWLLLSFCVTPGKEFTEGNGIAAGLTTLIGGLGLAAASALSIYGQRGDMMASIADLLGIFCGFCLCVSGAARLKGRNLPSALHILPYVAVMLRLISDFRAWSIDPIILDYCFRHFGLIFAMCAIYCGASLSFGKGRRRLTAFWAMGGLCLCAMGSVKLPLTEALLYIGLTFVCLGILFQITGTVPAEE